MSAQNVGCMLLQQPADVVNVFQLRIKSQWINKVITIQPPGTTNVWTSFLHSVIFHWKVKSENMNPPGEEEDKAEARTSH